MISTLGSLLGDLKNILLSIKSNSKALTEASSKIASSSKSLSGSSRGQAQGVQNAVSSINEISAMVLKNTDSAKESEVMSKDGESEAINGKSLIDNMTASIHEISTSNDNLMIQMEATNKEIKNIVSVISEIGEKTKVINDIVFQTKLLSFNASVEAARAGEHGKGFAVVADEVGKLAQMSGEASKEISDMLDKSISEVTDIVNKSQSRVTSLIEVGSEKVKQGIVTAEKCGGALDRIVDKVSSISHTAVHIAEASQEQSIGVQEVNKVMIEMGDVAGVNLIHTDTIENQSENLMSQITHLTHIEHDLEELLGDDSRVKPRTAINKSKKQRVPNGSRQLKKHTPHSRVQSPSQKLRSTNNSSMNIKPTSIADVVQVDFKSMKNNQNSAHVARTTSKQTSSKSVIPKSFNQNITNIKTSGVQAQSKAANDSEEKVPDAEDSRFEDF